MLIPSTDLVAKTTDRLTPCAWCRKPTVWLYRRGDREVAACRPDHAEKALAALRRLGSEEAIPENLAGRPEALAGSRLNPFAPRPHEGIKPAHGLAGDLPLQGVGIPSAGGLTTQTKRQHGLAKTFAKYRRRKSEAI
jgi:hypothetical protein